MDIQEALEPTGKAKYETAHYGSKYVKVRPDGVLYWHEEDGSIFKPIPFHLIFLDAWQPYPGKKEIRPERAGELWEERGSAKLNYYHTMTDTHNGYEVIRFVGWNSNFIAEHGPYHNQNGWKLKYSPDKEVMARIKEVEEEDTLKLASAVGDVGQEDIERIVIEDAENWLVTKSCQEKTIYEVSLPYGYAEQIENKPPMRMTLEIPKGK